MKKVKIALVFNLIIFISMAAALIWMMTGSDTAVLSASMAAAFRYFTVDSNVLMGIAAVIAIVEDIKILKGKKSEPSAFSLVAKLTGTVGVTLTMLVTIFFLAPTMGPKYGVLILFSNSNFLMHLLNPVLSIIVFLCFEKTDKIRFRHTFTAVIPLVIYGIYYTAVTIIHTVDGVIETGYDWYGFFFMGVKSAFIVLPAIIVITYGISLLLWKLNKKSSKRLKGNNMEAENADGL